MADMRRFYDAGDLDALVEGMTAEQDLLMKMAAVRQAIWYVEQILPTEEEDEGERGCLAVARGWLDEPTPENAERVGLYVAADAIDGGVRYHDYPAIFNDPALVASADNAKLAIHFTAFTVSKGREQEAKQWQLDVALAILQGREIPPFD